MNNELPKKKRYVLSDSRIAYCYVNPNFFGLTENTGIERLIEYIILTNGEFIVKKDDYLQSKYTFELEFDGISIWVGNYPYSYGYVYHIDCNTENLFKMYKDVRKETQPSILHKKRLNELLVILKKLGRISNAIETKD